MKSNLIALAVILVLGLSYGCNRDERIDTGTGTAPQEETRYDEPVEMDKTPDAGTGTEMDMDTAPDAGTGTGTDMDEDLDLDESIEDREMQNE